ncbi:MAG: putative nucleotidyltransferase substrate binding domain-containing protein [Desulfomonilaceae bacterium]
MAHPDNKGTLPSGAAINFLAKTLPFSELNAMGRKRIAESCLVKFFPKGTVILEQDVTQVTHLYLIQKGAVKIYRINEDESITPMDYCGEGATFGTFAIMSGVGINVTVEATEDTVCMLLDKTTLLEVLQENPTIARDYFGGFCKGLVVRAYSELRRDRVGLTAEDPFYLFSAGVGETVKGPPRIIAGSESIQNAAAMMVEFEIGSVLVSDSTNDVVGIITDKDLRARVVARGLNVGEPVEKIMSWPVLTVSTDDPCFEALLQMMNHKVHFLAVERDHKIVGVVTERDIMMFRENSPLDLLNQIIAQKKIDGLYDLPSKIPQVVRALIEQGAKANNITRVITVLHDNLLERLLTLMQEEMGPPPVPFFWLVMGSEGRKEQTFLTDQDNAVVYEDLEQEWETIKTAKLYFRHFGNKAIEHLVRCGYPLCKGKMMASNTRWRKPYEVWATYFDEWISDTDLEGTLHAKIFFDFRRAYGDTALAEGLRDHITVKARESKSFLRHLTKDCLAVPPPLSLLRSFVVEKNGEHRDQLDLKLRGLVPFVDLARAMALRHGVKETNTLGRLRLLAEGGHLPEDLVAETVEAYEFIMQLRLACQLEMVEAGRPPHNYVDPAELSHLERITLKASFDAISRLQSFVSRLSFQ